MSETAIVGLAGIAATALVGILAPLLTGRVHRRNVGYEQRLAVYRDLLDALRLIHLNAQLHASIPEADLDEEPTDAHLRDIEVRILMYGSSRVRKRLKGVIEDFGGFRRDHFLIAVQHRRVRGAEDGPADSHELITGRMHLGGIVDRVKKRLDDLEKTIRAELV
jgi:hypothetical protein